MTPPLGSPLPPSPGHVTKNVSDHVTPANHVTPPISVHAVIRIKPSLAKSSITEFSNSSITVTCAPQKRTFLYDHIFGPQTTQSEIYAHFSKSTDQFVAGYNVTIMAYGQSGAGKSYTMGTEACDFDNPNPGPNPTNPDPTNPDPDHEGIVQRASADIFVKLEEKYGLGYGGFGQGLGQGLGSGSGLGQGSGQGLGQPGLGDTSRDPSRDRPILTVSYVELYNEQFRDLLDPNPKPQPMVREDSQGHVVVSGLHHVTVTSLPALIHLLRAGSELRQKGSTALNSESSRSHAIFTITLTQNGASSKFNFVDLAGSERLKNSEAKGDRVREGIAINGGLAALGKVISQLSQTNLHPALSKHISYRDSKLTRLLQDSLGGKAVTYLLSCITCDDAFVSETLSTLSYTQRARAIQLTPEISQNEEVELSQLKREMEYWRGRARELERERSRDLSRETPSRMSSRDTPSRMSSRDSPTRMSRDSPIRSARDSPTRLTRDSPIRSARDLSRDSRDSRDSTQSPTRHHRNWSHDSLKQSDFDVLSPDTTFSPRDSTTDISRASPVTSESRDNGFSRLSNTTEMHTAVEDMIKQYDLRILGLEGEIQGHVTRLEEEEKSHVTSRARISQLEALLADKDAEIRELKARSESRATVVSDDKPSADKSDKPSADKSVPADKSGSAGSAGSADSAESRAPSRASRAPLESRIAVLETHLDKSRVQHRQTLDELKRLSSHYEVLSRDLDRSRKEVEKEKQLRYDVIAQMKRSSVSESREPQSGTGSVRSRATFASSLFGLPVESADAKTGGLLTNQDLLTNGNPPDSSRSSSESRDSHFH